MPVCDKQLCRRHACFCRISGAASKTHEMCAADASDPSSVLAFVKLVRWTFSITYQIRKAFIFNKKIKYIFEKWRLNASLIIQCA